MRTTSHLLHGWTKAAATAVPDDQELEKAFADQAYPFVEQKARPLMQPQHLIGFEIVYKNSPENTRLMGMFAFKVAKSLLFVPAFFINGTIKGVEFIYRDETKQFLPLTEESCEFLLDKNLAQEGRGVPRAYANRGGGARLNLGAVTAPPGYGYKYASTGLPKEKLTEVADAMLKAASESVSFEPMLADFVRKSGQPQKVLTALSKAASVSPIFTDMVARSGGPLDDLTANPPALFEKKASTSNATLVLHTGAWTSEVGVPSETYYQKGYWISDMRKEAAETDLPKPADAKDGIGAVTSVNGAFQSISSPGVYDLFDAEGKRSRALVLRTAEGGIGCSSGLLGYSGGFRGIQDRTMQVIVPSDKMAFCVGPGKLYGERISDVKPGKEIDGMTEANPPPAASPKADGDSFCCDGDSSKVLVIDTGSSVAGSLHYDKIEEVNGVKLLKNYNTVRGTINPDTKEVDWGKGAFTSDCRYLKLGKGWKYPWGDSDHPYLSEANVLQFMAGSKFHKAMASHDKSAGWKFEAGPYSLEPTSSRRMRSRATAAAFLCSTLGLRPDDAETVLDKAASESRFEFDFVPLEKSAYSLRMDKEPVFANNTDADFGVRVMEPESFVLQSDHMPQQQPTQLIGDAWDPAMGAQRLTSEDPVKLYEMSQKHNVANLFDAGAVSQLINTEDTGAAIDSYLVDITKGVDKIGRMLFLCYWKPDDFIAFYGSDDIASTEAELKSCFQKTGALLLKLMERTRDNRFMGASSSTSKASA